MSLELRDLAVDLGGRRIVTGVSLRVGDGQFAGLLGPNGSGKSTILKAIYRVHHPAAGQILLDGADLLALRPRAAARRVAVVAQEQPADVTMTVAELVMIGRTPHQGPFARDTAADRAAVTGAMARTGCAELAGRAFGSLSGGEKQRALISRALAQGADHLILDEPTNHLDIRYQSEILGLVASLGVTVLAALHDLNLAALFCDQVHLLHGGTVRAAGRPADVITPEAIRTAYGADVLVVDHPETRAPQILNRPPTVAGPADRKEPPCRTPAAPPG
jgi:iron complex transport system ATP-binding protein